MSDVKAPGRVLGDWLTSEAAADPDREFLQCASPWMTLSELDRASDSVAAGLQALGVRKGDRVAVNLPNRLEFAVLVFAIAKTGAIQVPLNTYLRGDFLSHQLKQTAPMTYIGDASALQMLAVVYDEVPAIEHVVVVGEAPERDSLGSLPAPLPYEQIASSEGDLERPELSAEDVCVIIYTSGTTGPSKGCTITHGYYCAIPDVFVESGWYVRGDRVFGANPMFHFSGQTWLVAAALAVGGSVIVEPAFSATTYMARIRETGSTVAMGMGAMGMAVMAQPVAADERDHALRHICFMPSSAPFVEAFTERFGIAPFAEVFGQSECWPATLGDPRQEHRPGSMGRITRGMQVKIVDEYDVEVPVGQPGEIVVRGDEPYRLFTGYWNMPEATVEVFRNLWHHTGDSGRVDEDGYYWFVDRKKDSMRRRGENVSSLELEAAILRHPALAAAAVHAVPSALGEDEIKACLILKPDTKVEAEELFDFFRTNLPYYAIPRYVEYLEALPANVNGRVQKFKLRERGITDETLDFESLGLVVDRADRRAG